MEKASTGTSIFSSKKESWWKLQTNMTAIEKITLELWTWT